MGNVRRHFRWICHPQMLVGFVVVCLCVGAFGNVIRSTFVSDIPPMTSNVKGVTAPSMVPDCSVVPCMALTFDDGPDPVITPRILDILARHQIKATFFMLGQRVAGNESIVQRIYGDGHELGNHSWSHPFFDRLSPADMDAQIHQTQQTIMMAGVPAPRLFRPPYGLSDATVIAHTNMVIARWNIDPQDWMHKDAGIIKDNMVRDAKPGGIVLLHDTQPTTADALEPAIQELKKSYHFVTTSQLLNLSPGDHGQYFGRGQSWQ